MPVQVPDLPGILQQKGKGMAGADVFWITKNLTVIVLPLLGRRPEIFHGEV